MARSLAVFAGSQSPPSSLSLLGRLPPLHLLVSACLFLPGQSVTRTLQLDYLYSLDPGASGPVHLYSAVFGAVTRQGGNGNIDFHSDSIHVMINFTVQRGSLQWSESETFQ